MLKQETLEAQSTICVSSLPEEPKMKKSIGSGKFKTMSKTHVNNALTAYLRSLSMINDDEECTNFNKAPDSLDVRIEKI